MTSAFFMAPQGPSEEGHAQLPLDPFFYGVIALVAFMVLLGVLWSFRNTLTLDAPARPEDTTPRRDPGR